MSPTRKTPVGLTVARIIMFAQAAASLGVWVGQLIKTYEHISHGQELYPQAVALNFLNPMITALLVIAAFSLASRPWARTLAKNMEAIGMCGPVLTVFTGFYQAIVAVLLAIGVIVLIVRNPTVDAANDGRRTA